MKIQDIHKPKGANKKCKRVGRGSGSGHGKTCGRGTKGAKSRSGPKLRPGFEGGQMPLIRRVPKRGFNPFDKKEYQIVNIEELNIFENGTKIEPHILREAGIIKKRRVPIKILGRGEIKKSLNVAVHAISASARKKIETSGGRVFVLEKN